jgi:hypothetical protein
MGCWTTTPIMWPPAAASLGPDMPAASAPSQAPARKRPLVEVLTFAGCPNRDAAIALVERVREQLGSNAEVQVIEVPDQQTAEQVRFLGSPTIRVDGHDIEPDADRCHDYVHACRLYQGEHRLGGLPAEDWLRQALLTAEGRP